MRLCFSDVFYAYYEYVNLFYFLQKLEIKKYDHSEKIISNAFVKKSIIHLIQLNITSKTMLGYDKPI